MRCLTFSPAPARPILVRLVASAALITTTFVSTNAHAADSAPANTPPTATAIPLNAASFNDGMPTSCNAAGTAGATVSLTSSGTTRSSFSSPVVRPVAFSQALYLDKVEIAFNARRTADGAVHLEGRTGDLVFRKTVQPHGQFTVELEARKDIATIAVDENVIRVAHGKKSKTITPGAGNEDDMDEAMKLLGESRAVRLFRVAAAAVQESDDDSGFSASMLLADGIVGQLTGDAGATKRVADHLSRHARARLKPASAEVSCYKTWEENVIEAAIELADCAESFSWWSIWKYVCSFRWYLEVESFWWTFIACAF